MYQSNPMVRVTRGPLTESVHSGHIAVVDASSKILYQYGNPNYVTFARSTAKLLQVIPLLESGAADYYKLTPAEIAVMCSSHNGEAEHVATVDAILAKLDLDATALLCGTHEPWHKVTREKMKCENIKPQPLHNNCSGKHANMLALAAYTGSPLTAYNSFDHPVQTRILQTICELAQVDIDDVQLGVDGCGVPVYGLNISNLALAFARFGSRDLVPASRADACQRILQALRAHPFMLGGSDRFDTELIRATKGRIIGKMGAEAIYAITVPEAQLGIVIKVADGSRRAVSPAVVEALRQLDLLTSKELEQLALFHKPLVTNRRGETVGTIEPILALRA